MPDSGKCSSCGAPILWGITKNDKRIPVNPTAVLNGNLEWDGDKVNYVKADPSVERFVSHYSDCPHADQHRREKAAKKAAEKEGGGA